MTMTETITNTNSHEAIQYGTRSYGLAILMMALIATFPMISEAETDGQRRPLDLPSGGGADEEDTDEEIPDNIQFFGQDFEGDAFFWVLDVSGSMSYEGRIDNMREEFIGAVQSLSRHSDFGALAFSGNMNELDGRCAEASISRKAAASSWIMALVPNGGTCMSVAVVKGLETLRKSTNGNRRLIVVGDGEPDCPSGGDAQEQQTMEEIQMSNWDRIPIDTVFSGGLEGGIDFFQDLASENQGNFVISQ